MGGGAPEIRGGEVFVKSPEARGSPKASDIYGGLGPSPMRGFIPPPTCQLSRLNLRSSAHDKGTVFGASALRRVPSGACGVRRLLRQAIRSEGRRKSDDTRAIQAAIDAAAKSGGGIVRLSGGVFLSGTVYLRDNIGLEILPGAKLKASADKNLYNRDDFCPAERGDKVRTRFRRAFALWRSRPKTFPSSAAAK